MSPSTPPHLVHSPWFWVHLFAIFCLAVLMVRGDKIVALRSQRAANAQMRARVAGRETADTGSAGELDDRERLWLIGAYGFFTFVAVASWWQVWRRVLRPKLRADMSASRSGGSGSASREHPAGKPS